MYSQLSLNGHLYKTDTWGWSRPYKMNTSLKQTVGAGPDGVRFRES